MDLISVSMFVTFDGLVLEVLIYFIVCLLYSLITDFFIEEIETSIEYSLYFVNTET